MGYIDGDDYVVVQGWMLSDLKLSGTELLVYAKIYGLSISEGHTFHGSLQYLMDWSNSSKSSVLRALTSLQEKNLISKNESFLNGVKFTEYSIQKRQNDTDGVKMNPMASNWNCQCQNETGGVKTRHNNTEIKENSNTIINNNITLKEKGNKIRHKHGVYGRVLLTEAEYDRLLNELGKDKLEKQIELLDEYIESNNNKNKYTNFNLVLRKSIKENWFNNNRVVGSRPRLEKTNDPEWLTKYVDTFEEGVEDL